MGLSPELQSALEGVKNAAAGLGKLKNEAHLEAWIRQRFPGVDRTPQAWSSGDLKYAAYTTPADGWLLCDGSAVSRTGATEALFAAIGTAFGAGDGSTTFNLPDARGRALWGKGTEARVANLGDNDARSLAARSPSHAHNDSHTHTYSGNTGTPVGISINSGANVIPQGSGNGHVHDASGTTTGRNTASTDAEYPAYLTVNVFIKT